MEVFQCSEFFLGSISVSRYFPLLFKVSSVAKITLNFFKYSFCWPVFSQREFQNIRIITLLQNSLFDCVNSGARINLKLWVSVKSIELKKLLVYTANSESILPIYCPVEICQLLSGVYIFKLWWAMETECVNINILTGYFTSECCNV